MNNERNNRNNVQVDLDKYIQEAHHWIDEIAVYMKTEERKDWAWSALRGVLHTLRDRLTPEEAFHLSAQLPMLIKGLYFEGYRVVNKPEKYHAEEFLDRIEEAMGPAAEFDAELVFKAVLQALSNHVSKGEIKDIYAMMPKDIRKLWDKKLKTYKL